MKRYDGFYMEYASHKEIEERYKNSSDFTKDEIKDAIENTEKLSRYTEE